MEVELGVTTLQPGTFVGIPCEIEPGPFPEEYVVSVSMGNGETISGFVRKENLRFINPESGFVKAKIIEVESDRIAVQIQGSFFAIASGQAHLPSVWAKQHLELNMAAA